MQNVKNIYENIIVPHLERQQEQNELAGNTNNVLEKLLSNIYDNSSQYNPFDYRIYNNVLNPQNKETYIENSYKDIPSIYSAPQFEMKAAPKRPFEDILKPKIENTVNDIKNNVNKAVEWAKKEPDILLNNKIDRTKSMIPHEQITDWLIKKPAKNVFPVSSDMYTDGMTGFSKAKQNPNAEIININDIKDENLKKKIKNFGVKDNERGVHYDTNSEASKLFSDSKDVKDFYEKNKEAIKAGKITENDFDFSVNKSKENRLDKKIDRHASIQHGKITDMKIDEKGRGTGKLIDRSDFEKRKPKSSIDPYTAINNHGYNMQEKGNYENYFSIIDILSQTKNQEEAIDLLEKLRRYFRMGI